MVSPLFAMPPRAYLNFLPISLLIVFMIAATFVAKTGSRNRLGEQNRRARLGLWAILCGPLVGASLAWIANALGHVHPVDLGYTYVVYTAIGAIAGLMAGVIFGASGFFCPRDSGGKSKSVKSVDVTDEV